VFWTRTRCAGVKTDRKCYQQRSLILFALLLRNYGNQISFYASQNTKPGICRWKNICHVLRPETPNRSVSAEVRKLIRFGLEAIRSVDSQSGHQDVRLLSALARLFSAQAAKAQDDGADEQLVTSLYLRASHYWSCAKPALENIKTGRAVRLSSQDRFFHLSG